MDELEEFRTCYKYQKKFYINERIASEVIEEDTDDMAFLLKEYYFGKYYISRYVLVSLFSFLFFLFTTFGIVFKIGCARYWDER